MKLIKLALRFWIALTSGLSFLAGWAMLAHAPKPVQAKTIAAPVSSVEATPLPTLTPLNLSGGPQGGGLQMPPITFQQPPAPPPIIFSQAPVFTTGGS